MWRTKFLVFAVLSAILIYLLIPSKDKLSHDRRKSDKIHNREYVPKSKNFKQYDQPDLAIAQNNEMTMDPSLGYPPVERMFKAFNDLKRSRKLHDGARIVSSEEVNWVERGPNNVGGRTRALMFDPNDPSAKKVWAGAIGGGLWYNEDITSASESWVNVNDFLANIAISALAYDPTNTTTFYASTGLGYTEDLRGAGIFKSIDAGINWVQLSGTANEDFYFIQNLKVDGDGTIYASTLSGVYISDNEGNTWTKTLEGRAGDLEVASDGAVYATLGVGTLGSIFKSTDSGLEWTNITPDDQSNPLRIEIASAPSNPEIIYAVADGGAGGQDIAWFYRSDDAGESWVSLTIPEYLEQNCESAGSHFTRGQAYFDLILGVHPEKPNKVVVGGIDLHSSDDSGKIWRPISYWTGSVCDAYVHADQHALIFRPGYPDEAIFGSDGGVSYSNDVGFADNPNFLTRNRGYNVTTYYAAAAANELRSNNYLAGAQDNGTQRYTQPFLNETSEATGGDGAFCFIDENNSDIQITSYIYNSYYISQNGGKTFVSVTDDQTKGRFINPSEFDSEANILYGAGGTGELTRIADVSDRVVLSNLTLETISVDLSGAANDQQRQITTIKASPHTANRLFVGVRVNGGEGLLFQIDDANTSDPTTTGITGAYSGSHGEWVSSIDVGETDDHLIATFSNYGVNSVYETTDGGANWSNRGGDLPDIPVRWGVFNPTDRSQVFLATELGVWSTGDITADNPDWEPTNIGLANVRTNMIKIRPVDNLMYIATYGRGLFTSDILVSETLADFDGPHVGYVGMPIDFKDLSTNANDSWSWDFGDGESSSDQNPTHTYQTAGAYSVSLSVDNGGNTEAKTNFISILPLKTAPYAATDGGDFETNQSDFTSIALSNDVNIWEIGSPSNSLNTAPSGANVWKTDLDAAIGDAGFDFKSAIYTPIFDLSTPGNYSLKFNLEMEIVYCNSPSALQVQYSLDNGNEWSTLGSSYPGFGISNWYNRSDNTGCSIEFDLFPEKVGWAINTDGPLAVEHTLNHLVGNDKVAFRIVYAQSTGSSPNNEGDDPYDTDGVLIDDFEITYSDPTADFTVSNTVSYTESELSFTYLSNGALTLDWDFGDGNKSTEENPKHTYENPGTYDVSLTITSTAGTETESTSIIIVPSLTVPYELSDGGDLETNQDDFGAENISGTTFELGNSSIAGKQGTASGDFAWVTGIDDEEYENRSLAYLYTPKFDFSNVGIYTFSFKANYKTEFQWDGFIVEYTTDNGQSWHQLDPVVADDWYDEISEENTEDPLFWSEDYIFTGDTGGEFQLKSRDISSLAGNAFVGFRFNWRSDGASVEAGIAIDDITIDGPEPGPGVPEFSFENAFGCEGNVVNFTNESSGSISSFAWDFGENASPTTAVGPGPHEVTYNTAGTSTISLTIISPVNGESVEIKEDAVITGAIHAPTLIRESSGGGYLLTASEGDAYEWFLDGNLIEGETNQTLEVGLGDKGSYSVIVTIQSCGVLTEEVIVNNVLEEAITVYPNPAKNSVFVDSNIPFSGEYQIFNLNGQTIGQGRIDNTSISIDISGYEDGIYYLKLLLNSEFITRQVIVRR